MLKSETLKYSLYQIKKNPLMIVGIILVLFLLLLAVFAPLIATHDPVKINPKQRLSPPSYENLLGTDQLGRDVFSRIVYGSRITIRMGITVILLALGIGMIMGLLALYARILDEIIMRLCDAFMSFPYLILAMAISMMLGPNLQNAILAMSLVWWPSYSRLIRGEALYVKEMPYVEAANSLGASKSRVIFRHVLPNSWVPVLIKATQDFGLVVIYGAGLSFIGLGAQPPQPEWGNMISEGNSFLRIAWWCSVFPGVGIIITVLGSNLLGDGLRDLLDPKLKSK
jgi:peptide/nickel transport system permease protein